MIRLVAKPVDQYINEDHIEDCEYFTRGQVPFNDCEVKEQIKDEENQVWETVAIILFKGCCDLLHPPFHTRHGGLPLLNR